MELTLGPKFSPAVLILLPSDKSADPHLFVAPRAFCILAEWKLAMFPVENILEVSGGAMLYGSTGSYLGTLTGAFDQNVSLTRQWGVNPSGELGTQTYASLPNTFDPTGNAVPLL